MRPGTLPRMVMPISRTVTAVVTPVCALWLFTAGAGGANPKFYRDDPIARDPETQDASAARLVEISGQFDLIENSFLHPGDRLNQRALNVNTIDEVPDSSWFTNRLGLRARQEPGGSGSFGWASVVRRSDASSGPSPGTWRITGRKSEGVTPGFTITDSTGEIYWIKFDPKGFSEMASGAEVISTKFLHAFGYHVPQNSIATLRRETLEIAPDATMKDEDGRRRPLTELDVDDVLANAARGPDGTYRVLASRNLPGRVLGPFRYHGTRPDDPNDIFPHEHRRELRGLSVFAAWLNHDEVRSTNSLDTVVSAGGRQVVRHHLLDFGSTLGSGTVKAQSRRAGNEFAWESRPTLITMLTLGLYVRPWLKVDYPEIPAVGRFEATYFTPDQWKPDYPNPAFRNVRVDDRFWAARILSMLTDEEVATVVREAHYSDQTATDYITATLIERKRKVLDAWLNGTNPVVNVALSANGELSFENAAERARVAAAAEGYAVQWSRFDNVAIAHENVGVEQRVTQARVGAPAELLDGRPEYIAVRIRAIHAARAAWADPVMAYFRKVEDGWSLVGLERNP
jgi:hypothetical protein